MTLWVPFLIPGGAARQAELGQSCLLGIYDLFSIPATFTLAFPLLISCQNIYD